MRTSTVIALIAGLVVVGGGAVAAVVLTRSKAQVATQPAAAAKPALGSGGTDNTARDILAVTTGITGIGSALAGLFG